VELRNTLVLTENAENKRTFLTQKQRKIKSPILCDGGHWVVFSAEGYVWAMPWSGDSVHCLSHGFASDVWEEPSTGIPWVYISTASIDYHSSGHKNGVIVRRMLSDPSRCDTVWNEPVAGWTWYQVSRDGHIGVGLLPWDHVMVVYDGAWPGSVNHRWVGSGCWSSVADSTGGVWMHLDGRHLNIIAFCAEDSVGTIPFGIEAAGELRSEIACPRFASHGGRFVCLVAGLTPGRSETTDGEVYFAKFNDTYSAVEQWCVLTDDNTAQAHPDAWVGVSPSASVQAIPADTSLPRWEHDLPQVNDTIHISSPRTGEEYSTGDTLTIEWSVIGMISGCVVGVSLDGGITFVSLSPKAVEVRQNIAAFEWVIPGSITDESGEVPLQGIDLIVRVHAYSDQSVFDEVVVKIR
jgi:hypothetical protein